MGKLVLTRNRIAKLKASPVERKRWFLLQKKSSETYVALNFLTTTMYSQIPYMGFKDKFELRLRLQKGRARRPLFTCNCSGLLCMQCHNCSDLQYANFVPWSIARKEKITKFIFQSNVSRAMQLGRQLEAEAQTRTNLCL